MVLITLYFSIWSLNRWLLIGLGVVSLYIFSLDTQLLKVLSVTTDVSDIEVEILYVLCVICPTFYNWQDDDFHIE